MRPVPIHLDRVRHLWFDLNALAELESAITKDVPGFSLGKLADLQLGNARVLRVLLWAGLLHDDPTLTIREVGQLVTAQHFGAAAEAVGKALTASFGTGASEEANPPNPNGGDGTTASTLGLVSSDLNHAPSGG